MKLARRFAMTLVLNLVACGAFIDGPLMLDGGKDSMPSDAADGATIHDATFELPHVDKIPDACSYWDCPDASE